MLNYLKSSVGKKFIMGLSGLALAGFVFAHMVGNLLIFNGAEAYNMYGHLITSNPLYPLISYGLLAVFLVHGLLGALLTKENNTARTGRYAVEPDVAKSVSVASKTMIFSGTILLVFLITHLASFKYGAYYEATYNGVVVRDLHRLMVEVFASPMYIFWYFVSLVVLAVHLRHGVASSFQSIGLSHPRYTPFIKTAGVIYAVVVALGFISQPIYVYWVHNS